MRYRILTRMVVGLALVLGACAADPPSTTGPSSDDGDTGRTEADGGGSATDGGVDPDGEASPDGGGSPGPAPGDMVYSTSGGGTVSSDRYRLQLNVGAPSSKGSADNDNYRIQVAPVSP